VDELNTRQAVVDAMLQKAGKGTAPPPSSTLLINSKAARMADRHVTLYTNKGLLKKVEGVEALAAHLNLTVDPLIHTFASYNKAAEQGKDEFGRTVFPAGHWPVEPNETFYVGQVVPVIHYTMGGIAIDTDGRVLSQADEKAIPGLYAAGEASGGVHGANRLAGNSLLECTVFGRHVGLTLPLLKESSSQLSQISSSGTSPSVPDPRPPLSAPEEAPKQAAVPSTASTELRSISAEELGKHRTVEDRTWLALYGMVYDLTDYVEDHPGGAEAITNVAGTEATETFETVHNKELLDSMGFEPIGKFAG